MNTKRLHLLFYSALLILAALLFVLPVSFAQDEPADAGDPPAATLEPTQEASPVAPVNVNINTGAGNPSGASGDLPEGNISIPGWSVVVAIVLAIAGGAGLSGVIDRIRTSPLAIAEIERRVDELPEPVTGAMHRAGEALESAARLLTEASDRIAASTKPPETQDLGLVGDTVFDAEARRRGYTRFSG